MNKYWERRLHTWSNSVRKRLGKPKKTYVEKLRYAANRSAGIPRASFEAAVSPRLAVVAMARDEEARAHEIMRHFTALFDAVVVIDHLSQDATGEIIAGYDGSNGCDVTLVRSEEAGYLQSEYMSQTCSVLIDAELFDWIFFVDFDEFLPFMNRSELNQTLVHVADEDVINFSWINCLPDDLSATRFCGSTATISAQFSEYEKVAVNARRLKGRKIKIEQGNHTVLLDDAEKAVSGQRAAGLYHFPVSDPEKLAQKLERGVRAYEDLASRDESQGRHWRELQDNLDRLKNDHAFLQKVTLNYGDELPDVMEAPEDVIRKVQVNFAQAPSCEPRTDLTPDVITAATLGEVLREKLAGDPVAKDPLDIPALYKKLEPRESRQPTEDNALHLKRAVLAGSQALDLVLPTSWAGHEPFLFSLMEVARPRRYVELGSHHGHSFFTACQHYKLNQNYGEAVAIDLWEGDHQAGFYGDEVFDRFRSILDEHFKQCGRFIRSYFSEAANVFEPGSIDLLHIDGLHTYEAVKEDFETWLPKLTENGVVLFHDTSEYQTDFGVWQLFDEIREQAAASFRFVHGHGLGVAAFGTRDQNPAIELIEHIAAEPALFEFHYANLGKSLHTAARHNADEKD
ncbi:MAG: class I SAM-dependent methyltransferase [Pseudomonadota bacterium]